jgi:hypothetical protein
MTPREGATLGNYKNFARAYCARRRPAILGGHPLHSWVFKEYLAHLLGCQESAVDHLNAIRLLQALVAAGANTRAPMASAWIDKIAVRDMELHGTALTSAIAFAEEERWLIGSRRREDWIYLTRTGEVVAKLP